LIVAGVSGRGEERSSDKSAPEVGRANAAHPQTDKHPADVASGSKVALPISATMHALFQTMDSATKRIVMLLLPTHGKSRRRRRKGRSVWWAEKNYSCSSSGFALFASLAYTSRLHRTHERCHRKGGMVHVIPLVQIVRRR
jgi:hypothetical protein